jgi:hypothetical protein
MESEDCSAFYFWLTKFLHNFASFFSWEHGMRWGFNLEKRKRHCWKRKHMRAHTHTKILSSMQLHRLLVEAPLSPYFCVNSMTCFSHTGPLSGIHDDSHKLLYYEVLSESSQTRSKKKDWLNLLTFGCHLLQSSLLGNVYSNPIVFSALQKHRGSHFP